MVCIFYGMEITMMDEAATMSSKLRDGFINETDVSRRYFCVQKQWILFRNFGGKPKAIYEIMFNRISNANSALTDSVMEKMANNLKKYGACEFAEFNLSGAGT